MATADAQVIDVRRILDQQKFGLFNIGLIVLAILATFAAGFDVSAMGFAAPGVAKAMHITNRAEFTWVLLASQIAYLPGAPGMGWLGDRYGRRMLIVTGCLWFGIFSFLCMTTDSLNGLFWFRLATGLGLGGLVPCVNSTLAEWTPRRYRGIVLLVANMGILLGAGSPGYASALLVPHYGWKAIFFVGGLVPCLIGILAFFAQPESIKYLVHRGDRTADVERLLHRADANLFIPPNPIFVITGETRQNVSTKRLFTDGLAWVTPLMWVLIAANFVTSTFLNGWMPLEFGAAGFSPAVSAIASSMYQGGAIFGSILAGLLLDRFGVVGLGGMMLVGCFTVSFIGFPGHTEFGLMATVFVTGFLILGAENGTVATPAMVYPTPIRAKGAGVSVAIARFAAILGPLAGGLLLSLHLPMQRLFMFPVIPEALGIASAAVLTVIFYRRYHGLRLDDKAAHGMEETVAVAAAE